MTKKSPRHKASQAYFRSVLANERRIQYLEAEIEKQQSRLALNGVEMGENVSLTMEGSALEEGFSKLYETIDELDTELCGYVETREEARKVLSHIADSKGYEVLYLRYLEGFRIKDISAILYSSERHIFRLHDESLLKCYLFLPIEFKQRKA